MPRRRLRGEGSIYQRASDGRWVGVVDFGQVDGKRVRKTVTASTKKLLTPKYLDLKRQAGVDGDSPSELTTGQWVAKWLLEVAGEKNRPSTLRTYENYVKNWIEPNVGRIALVSLRPDHVRSLMAKMKAEGKPDSTRRQVYAILRRSLKVAEMDGLIPHNPAARVDAPSVEHGSHGKFTLAEAKVLLAACQLEDGTVESRWIAALLAGLRQGEALGLDWEHVDLAKERIYIEQAAQQVKGKGVQIVPLKSKASYRAIPMVGPVSAALELEVARTGYVWGTDNPRAPRRDWGMWQDFLDRAGVERRPLHAARATCGSLLLEADVPEKIIAEILGHAQVQITREHYLHGDDSMHVAAMGRMSALLES